MRLPFVALVLASFTFATGALADAKKPKPPHKPKVHAHLSKPKAPPLPEPKEAGAKTDPKKAAAKPEPKKPEAKKPAPEPEDPYDDPPEELTGALPQKKLASKKPKPKDDKPKDEKDPKAKDPKAKDSKEKDSKEKDPKEKDPKAKKDDKDSKGKKDDKILIPHSGKPAKVGAKVPAEVEFQNLQKKSGGDTKKTKQLKACVHPAITFARLGQPTDVSFPLTTCKGAAAPGAVENLSVLARPYDVPEPSLKPATLLATSSKKDAKPSKALAMPSDEIAPGIRRVNPGLVTRLQAIADKFPGKTITLVSGYRPASKGSPHQAARAFDIRIDGVTNEALVAFCKTLPDTGCGYYPNSYFVHVDVRPEGAGHVYWIDISGPGEKPVYVKEWPPPAKPQLPDAKAEAAKPDGEKTEGEKTEGEKTGGEKAAPAAPEIATTTDSSAIGPLEESDEDEPAPPSSNGSSN